MSVINQALRDLDDRREPDPERTSEALLRTYARRRMAIGRDASAARRGIVRWGITAAGTTVAAVVLAAWLADVLSSAPSALDRRPLAIESARATVTSHDLVHGTPMVGPSLGSGLVVAPNRVWSYEPLLGRATFPAVAPGVGIESGISPDSPSISTAPYFEPAAPRVSLAVPRPPATPAARSAATAGAPTGANASANAGSTATTAHAATAAPARAAAPSLATATATASAVAGDAATAAAATPPASAVPARPEPARPAPVASIQVSPSGSVLHPLPAGARSGDVAVSASATPPDAQVLQARAGAAITAGRRDEALTLLRAALQLDPTAHASRQALLSLLGAGPRDEAWLTALDEAAAASPERFGLLAARGHADAGRLDAALRALDRVPEKARGPEHHATAGVLLQRAGRHAEAATELRAALANVSPEASQVGALRVALASSLEARGDRARARAELEAAAAAPTAPADVREVARERLRALPPS